MAGIAASNLLGDKFINITKGTQPHHVQPDDEIRSVPNQDIPELMAQSASSAGDIPGPAGARRLAPGRRGGGQGQHRQVSQGRRALYTG